MNFILPAILSLVFVLPFHQALGNSTKQDTFPPEFRTKQKAEKVSLQRSSPSSKVFLLEEISNVRTNGQNSLVVHTSINEPIKTHNVLTENLIYREMLEQRKVSKQFSTLCHMVMDINQAVEDQQAANSKALQIQQKDYDTLVYRIEKIELLLTHINNQLGELKQSPERISTHGEPKSISLVPPYHSNKNRPSPPLLYLFSAAIVCMIAIFLLYRQLSKEQAISSISNTEIG